MPTVTLHTGHCLAYLREMKTGSVDAIITDPPYPGIKRSYGQWTEEEWHGLMDKVVRQCRRILKPTGSAVFVLQPNQERLGRTRPWLWEFMAKWSRDWNMVQDVWWWNYAAMPCSTSIQGGMTRPSLKACVWLGDPDCYKDQSRVLWTESERNIAVRTGKRCSGKTTRHASGHQSNEKRMTNCAVSVGGVSPFNVLPISNTDSTNSSGSKGHGAGTPVNLCDWWIRFICPPKGVVLDPFSGAGSVGAAAIRNGCSYVGIEKLEPYTEIAKERLAVELKKQERRRDKFLS